MTRAMPHIKTYTRTSKDTTEMAFFILTSANLSKAAWGSVSKAGNSCLIMSYEAGVLWLPSSFCQTTLRCLPFAERRPQSQEFPLHYDIPPTPYGKDQKPWLMDYILG